MTMMILLWAVNKWCTGKYSWVSYNADVCNESTLAFSLSLSLYLPNVIERIIVGCCVWVWHNWACMLEAIVYMYFNVQFVIKRFANFLYKTFIITSKHRKPTKMFELIAESSACAFEPSVQFRKFFDTCTYTHIHQFSLSRSSSCFFSSHFFCVFFLLFFVAVEMCKINVLSAWT